MPCQPINLLTFQPPFTLTCFVNKAHGTLYPRLGFGAIPDERKGGCRESGEGWYSKTALRRGCYLAPDSQHLTPFPFLPVFAGIACWTNPKGVLLFMHDGGIFTGYWRNSKYGYQLYYKIYIIKLLRIVSLIKSLAVSL